MWLEDEEEKQEEEEVKKDPMTFIREPSIVTRSRDCRFKNFSVPFNLHDFTTLLSYTFILYKKINYYYFICNV